MRVAILGPFSPTMVADCIRTSSGGPASLPAGTGGTNIVNLVRARLSRGLETDVITLDPGLSTNICRWEGVNLKLWVVRRRSRHALRDGFRSERRLLHEALRQSSAQVCHAHWTYEYGAAAVTQHLMPHVVSVHDHAGHVLRWADLRYLGLYILARLVLNRARSLSAVSPYVAEYVSGIVHKPVPVVPNILSNMVWTSTVPAPDRTSDSPTVISAVNWSRLKNVKTALRAFRLLREAVPGVRYSLLGPGLESGGPGHRWAARFGLSESVEFLGCLPHETTLKLIRQSTVLLHPSMEEASPGAVSEAMALRTPVVACSEAGGSAWLLDNGRAGVLTAGTDPTQMAGAIEKIIRDTDASRRLTEHAFHRIGALCNEDTVLGGYEEIYARAASEFT